MEDTDRKDWRVEEVLDAWAAARAAGGDRFYEELHRLTGLTEADVKEHFAAWTKLRHETAEEVAEENGVTVREAGFQAYLTNVLRLGRPRIIALDDFGYVEDFDPNPRSHKPWPEAEDCKGCDGRDGLAYQHRWGCHIYGGKAGQVVLPVTQGPDGKFTVDR